MNKSPIKIRNGVTKTDVAKYAINKGKVKRKRSKSESIR